MKNAQFGFSLQKEKDLTLEQAKKEISADIESYWGQECLMTSSSFALTLK